MILWQFIVAALLLTTLCVTTILLNIRIAVTNIRLSRIEEAMGLRQQIPTPVAFNVNESVAAITVNETAVTTIAAATATVAAPTVINTDEPVELPAMPVEPERSTPFLTIRDLRSGSDAFRAVAARANTESHSRIPPEPHPAAVAADPPATGDMPAMSDSPATLDMPAMSDSPATLDMPAISDSAAPDHAAIPGQPAISDQLTLPDLSSTPISPPIPDSAEPRPESRESRSDATNEELMMMNAQRRRRRARRGY